MNGFHNHSLKKRFERENPQAGIDEIDWSITEKGGTYDENLQIMREEYPQHKWGPREDYDSYARSYLKTEGEKMGLEISVKVDSNPRREADPKEFMAAIAEDIKQTLILMLSEKGHGKSSSLKTIVAHCMKADPGTVYKVFDASTSWFHSSPLRYRQKVTNEALMKGEIINVDNCVYELGSLSKEGRKRFMAEILKRDYKVRYDCELRYGKQNMQPWIIYIIEEAESYLGSYALRSNDAASDTLRDFVSIGRNFRMSAFLVATAEVGELSPSIRRRARRIYGRIVSPGDINEAKRVDKRLGETVKTMRRYHFTYSGERVIGPIKIGDEVKSIPTEYVKPQPKTVVETPKIKIHLTTQPTQTHTPNNPHNLWINLILSASTILLLIAYIL